MNIRPLTQLRELIATALKSQVNIGKSFQSFFIETMELFLTHTGRLNFTRMARCGRSCESRFRQNFKKPFDWFWSGCAAAMKKGLEILGISIVDADAKDAVCRMPQVMLPADTHSSLRNQWHHSLTDDLFHSLGKQVQLT